MTEKTTTEDIVLNLQKIINPILSMTAHYDLLSLFVEECGYDGAVIDEKLDLIDDYYSVLQEATNDLQRTEIINDCIRQGINPQYLSEFFIIYDKDLQQMKQYYPKENKKYMKKLYKEAYNPTELIRDVKAYVATL